MRTAAQGAHVTTCPTIASPREKVEYNLRVKLNRLLLARHDLRKECQTIPPSLETAIMEVRQALGLENGFVRFPTLRISVRSGPSPTN